MVTILVMFVLLCPKYLWEHLEEKHFILLHHSSVVWPHALEQNGVSLDVHDGRFWWTEPESEGGTRKSKNLKGMPSVSLLSTKSHTLQFLPPPKITPLAWGQALTYQPMGTFHIQTLTITTEMAKSIECHFRTYTDTQTHTHTHFEPQDYLLNCIFFQKASPKRSVVSHNLLVF